ncbi:MAG: molybdopterin-guanine dinucleotide biosynthesis protein B [Thermoleophilia bacterium]
MIDPRRGGLSVAILTGGDSVRMGADKATRELGGKPLAQHVIDALRPLAADMFLVGNAIEEYRRFGLPVSSDLHAARSSLVGIYSAIAASRGEKCLVVSCDLPFADPALARMMLALADGYDAVVPVSPAGMEPLFAIYTRGCLDTMADFIKREDFKILNVLDRLKVRWVTPAEMRGLRDPSVTFFNINTPGDLEQAEAMAGDVEAAGAILSQPPLVCFVGFKNSGKTTFLEALVGYLSDRGVRVACIKHDVHGFTIDHEGTDTYRLAQAGARKVVISAPHQYALVARVDREQDLGELRREIGGAVDIILAEGYKGSAADKIAIVGRDSAEGLPCAEAELIAVVSDEGLPAVSLPVFSHGDIAGVARFIGGRYGITAAVGREAG